MKIRCCLVVLLIFLPVATAQSAERGEVDWTPLFNGKDLQGWKELPDHSGHWKVEDGAIVGRGAGGGYLFSERGDYEDFHLRVEAQINNVGDGGIYFRSESGLSGKSKSGVYPAGIEVQIRVGGPEKTERTGSLGHVKPVNDRLTEPNVWFTLEVIAEGKHIVIKVNDKTTVDFVDENGGYKKGHIVLQQYTPRTVVKFRKIELKDLTKRKEDAAERPVAMDLCQFQTPIRNVGGRDSGPDFRPVAAVEAACHCSGVKFDLSKEHLIWLPNVAEYHARREGRRPGRT